MSNAPDLDDAYEAEQADNDRLRAEITRLTAELAAARAVPPDVEAAIESTIDHYWFGALEIDDPESAEGTEGFRGWPDTSNNHLRTAIARAISDATAATRAELAVAVHELGEVTRAFHAANDAIGEVCRLVGDESTPGAADMAGNDASTKRDAVAKVRALVEASKSATVGKE